jgi:hypothetical protein
MSRRTLIRADGSGRITRRHQASSTIGAGANYRQDRFTLAGKVEGSGRPPRIAPRGRYLQFTAAPSAGPGNDRSELAWTEYLPLSRDVLIEWDLRVPSGTPSARGFYAPLQLWQAAPHAPIYAPRFQPGSAHALAFPGSGTAHLIPDRWHSVTMLVSGRSVRSTVDGRTIGPSSPTIGLPPGPYPDGYRVKFGIYREHAPIAAEVHINNLTISYL